MADGGARGEGREDNVILDNLFQDASRKKSFARGNLVRAVCSPIRRSGVEEKEKKRRRLRRCRAIRRTVDEE